MIIAYKNLSVIRGLAIVMVVWNHAAMAVLATRLAPPFADEPLDTIDLVSVFAGVTVPFASIAGFMVASGFFMGKFATTWSSTRAVVVTIATRYLGWSLFGITYLLLTSKLPPLDVLVDVAEGFGPFPAYWFFASLLVFGVLTPVFVRLADERPWLCLLGFVLLEVARAASFYTIGGWGGVLVPLQGSYFVLGVLLSRHTTVVIERLGKHRRWFAVAAALLLLLTVLETHHLYDASGSIRSALSADRPSLRAFSVAATVWLLLLETRRTRLRGLLDWLGLRSMAVFLSFDLCLQLAMKPVWHASIIARWFDVYWTTPPPFARNPLLTLYYLAAGLLGPLALAWLVKRIAGNRAHKIVFG